MFINVLDTERLSYASQMMRFRIELNARSPKHRRSPITSESRAQFFGFSEPTILSMVVRELYAGIAPLQALLPPSGSNLSRNDTYA